MLSGYNFRKSNLVELDKAIAEHRRLKKTLNDMRRVSRKIMRLRFPDTERRTRLNKKVLRLI